MRFFLRSVQIIPIDLVGKPKNWNTWNPLPSFGDCEEELTAMNAEGVSLSGKCRRWADGESIDGKQARSLSSDRTSAASAQAELKNVAKNC